MRPLVSTAVLTVIEKVGLSVLDKEKCLQHGSKAVLRNCQKFRRQFAHVLYKEEIECQVKNRAQVVL